MMSIEDMTNSELSDAIDEYVRGEKARNILKRRLIDLMCYEPLAEEWCMSVSQIKRIVYKAQEQLFKRLQ